MSIDKNHAAIKALRRQPCLHCGQVHLPRAINALDEARARDRLACPNGSRSFEDWMDAGPQEPEPSGWSMVRSEHLLRPERSTAALAGIDALNNWRLSADLTPGQDAALLVFIEGIRKALLDG